MATESVVIDFQGDASGLKPLADALKALGQLTDEQIKAFNDATKAAENFGQKSAKATKETEKSAEELNKSFKEFQEGIIGGATEEFAKQMKAVGLEATKTTETSKRLTTQLRELKNQLATLPEGSKEFKKVAIEAAKLEDKIGDVSKEVRILASDSLALDTMTGIARGIAGGFALAQGAAALFGKENEDVQKALLKVNAAMAILQGLQEVSLVLRREEVVAVGLSAAAQKAYAIAVGTSTGAMKGFRIALAATGIGLLVLALVALVMNFDKVKEKITDLFPSLNKLGDIWTTIKDSFFGFIAGFTEGIAIVGELIKDLFTGNIDELVKDASEAGQRLSNAFNDAVIEQQKKRSAEYVKAMTEADIESNQRRVQILEAWGKDSLAIRERIARDELSLLEKNTKEYYDKKLELELLGIERIKKARAEDRQDITFDPKAAEKQAEEVRKSIEGKIKADPIKLQAKVDKVEIPESSTEESTRTLRERIGDAFTDEEFANQVKEASLALAQETSDAIFAITGERRNAEYEQELASLDKEKNAKLANKKLTEGQRAAIEAQYKKKEAKIREEQFKKDKAAAIIQALINGALGIAKSIATLGPPPNPAGIAGLAAVAASTALSVALIAAQPVPKFAKGTKNAPEGLALVGEQGAELVHLPGGAKVIPHPASMKILDGHIDSEKILSDYNINTTGGTMKIDYQRLASELGKELSKHPKTTINVDENGLRVFIQSENHRVERLEKRYASK